MSCVWDATFGQVQTKVLNTILQKEGERERHQVHEAPGRARRGSSREKQGKTGKWWMGPDVVSLLAVVS